MVQIRTRKRLSLPRFNLDDANSKFPTLIYLVYRYKTDKHGKKVKLKYSTAKKVLPKYWTGAEAKESALHQDHTELNVFLRKLKDKAFEIAKKEPLIDVVEFKNRLDKFNGYAAAHDSTIPTLPEYIEQYCNKVNRNSRTIQKYEGVKTHLESYSELKDYPITFENVTMDFRNDFIDYLRANGVKSDNTLSKIMMTIKMFMAEAQSEKVLVNGDYVPYHKNDVYKNKNFGVPRIKTSKHYLYYSELEELFNYDLSKNERLNKVRDLFLIACYTGLRISDAKRLTKNHIVIDDDGDMFIDIHTFKGRTSKEDNQVVIPIIPRLKELFVKYDYELPAPYSDQKQNEYLKELCKLVGIKRKVVHKSSDNGEINESFLEIWQKVSNHTARYTYINIMINDFDISPVEMQKITGQSLKVLIGYERGNKLKNAKKVAAKVKPQIAKIRKIS